jgi:hypothetical protein
MAHRARQGEPALTAIEARGYVERIPDPDDKRAVIARHTPAGRRILLAAIDVMLDRGRVWCDPRRTARPPEVPVRCSPISTKGRAGPD